MTGLEACPYQESDLSGRSLWYSTKHLRNVRPLDKQASHQQTGGYQLLVKFVRQPDKVVCVSVDRLAASAETCSRGFAMPGEDTLLRGGRLSMNSLAPIAIWLSQLKDGDAAAARQLWDTYFLKMVEVARLKLHGTRTRMADEEDVALSAFKSFCHGARDGRFPQLLENGDPWPLLLALTNHKAIDLVRHERRVKRGGPGLRSRCPDSPEVLQGDDGVLSQFIGREPDPRWTYEVAEECQQLLDRLSDSLLRGIAVWKIEGFTTEEIAAKLGCASRTVERKLQLIRRLWKADPPYEGR